MGDVKVLEGRGVRAQHGAHRTMKDAWHYWASALDEEEEWVGLTSLLGGGAANLEEVWIGVSGRRREGPGRGVAGSVSGKRIRDGPKLGLAFSAVSIFCSRAGDGWEGGG